MVAADPAASRVCAPCRRHVSEREIGMMAPMADSNALRSRRKRLHAQGDHSLCRRDCSRPKFTLAPLSAEELAGFDPVAEMRALAGRLAEAYSKDPGNAALARELRATLLALPVTVDEEPSPLDLLRARRSERDREYFGMEERNGW
jgi:hypothetical protein